MGHSVKDRELTGRLIGYMPEHDCVPPDSSAADFVAFLGRCSGLSESAARERSSEVLRHVGLFEERYRPAGSYSTGMMQRVKLAQALVHDPQVLVLDEPTNGLDPAGRDDMLSLISRTSKELGISVLISSHLLSELERICDGIVLIANGRVQRSERLDDLIISHGVLNVEIDGDTTALVRDLAARGILAEIEAEHILVHVDDANGYTMEKVCDAVRDSVSSQSAALLRMERKRKKLSDLFSENSDE